MDREELNNQENNEIVEEEIVINENLSDIPETEEAYTPPAFETDPETPPVYNSEPKNKATELKTKNIFAVISMVSGIVALIFSCCCLLSIPCSIAAIVFGILSLKSERRAMAIAGIVIGAVSIVISVIVAISIIVAIIIENAPYIYPSRSSCILW